MASTVEVRTDEMIGPVLEAAWPGWLKVRTLTEMLPAYRSQQSVQQHLKAMHERGLLERRVRDEPGAPFEYRVKKEASGIGEEGLGKRVNG